MQQKRVPRLRLVEPTSAVSSGGTRISAQGLWFKGPPHTLTIHLSIPLVGKTIDIVAQYVTETQLTFVVPNVTGMIKSALAEAWVSLSIPEASMASEGTPLPLLLYPELSTKKVFPMHMPLSATSNAKVSLFLNLRYALSYILDTPDAIKLDDQTLQRLRHITSLPIFARVSYVSENTNTPVEVTRTASWNAASVLNGDLMIEFDPPRAPIGVMQVQVSLNKVDFFGHLGYTVLRDFALTSVRPRCIVIHSTQSTEITLRGTNFLETGEIIIQLSQPPPEQGPTAPYLPLVNINGVCHSLSVISGPIPPKTRHGLTSFAVSCNHGEHFCPDSVVGLIYRERTPHALVPTEGSIAGGTTLKILVPVLDDDHLDSFQLLRSVMKVSKVIRVRFEPVDTAIPSQIVFGEPDMDQPGAILCQVPAFDVPKLQDLFPVKVSISLDGKTYSGGLSYTYFGRFAVRALSMHHGPNTGGTHLRIQMNHAVPPNLPIAVKFTSKANHSSMTVVGHMVNFDSIECITPVWTSIENLQLTKVQVSLNQGLDFIPPDEPTSNLVKFKNALDVDDAYLLFLFYTPPVIDYIWPTSSSEAGGGLLRLKGKHVVDHGGIISVVFSRGHQVHRKVRGFIELDPTRHSDVFGDSLTLMCCAPPFDVGVCDVFVSLNDQQYSKCQFQNILVPTRTQFLFFKAPCITSVSPICSASQAPTTLVIQGEQFIDTGSIQIRFTHQKDDRDGRQTTQFVEGKLNADGHVVCQTPVLKVIQPVVYSNLDISLNSCEYTDLAKPFYFFRLHKIVRVEPDGMALELPTQLRVYLAPEVISDLIKLRLRVTYKSAKGDITKGLLGSTDAANWTKEFVDWLCPPMSAYVRHPSQLMQAQLEVAMNGQHYLEVGNLLQHCAPYCIPKVHRLWPTAAPFEDETEIHIFGEGFDNRHEIVVRASIPGMSESVQVTRTTIAEFISPEQIMFVCPRASDFAINSATNGNHDHVDTRGFRRTHSKRRVAVGGWKVLPIHLELSILHGQFCPIPFGSQFYFPPTTLAVTPLAGFTTGGTVVTVTLEAMQVHYMHLIDDRIPLLFGPTMVCGLRDGNTIKCIAPELPAGHHLVQLAINQHTFQPIKVHNASVYFEAFPPPQVFCPAPLDDETTFGPITGGTPVHVTGIGFVPTGITLVKFVFANGREFVVHGTFVDTTHVECVAPAVNQVGLASIQVSCNGQQYSHHSDLQFEFHLPTTLQLDKAGATCGSTRGGTLIVLHVLQGLPVDVTCVRCVVKVVDLVTGSSQRTAATFDTTRHSISFHSPAWAYPCKVQLFVSLNNQVFFIDSGYSFLYYTPPQPIAAVMPGAGPITGHTCVTVECADVVDTGDVTFKLSNGTNIVLVVQATFHDGVLGFLTPSVSKPCRFNLQLSLNGIDYSLVQPDVVFEYYMPPVLQAMTPSWGAIDAETTLTLSGDYIEDYGAPIHVQFVPWHGRNSIVVDGVVRLSDASAQAKSTVECVVPQSMEPGYCRVELSLNGQQFTASEYPDPRHLSPLAIHKVKPLFPFRCFVPPFFLATTYGSAGGGSRVMICGSTRLMKLMARSEYKCHVQFTPARLLGHPSPSAKLPESVMVTTELDPRNGTITCRAPSFRFACLANVELLFGDIRKSGVATATFPDHPFSVDASLVHLAKEKFYFYDSPSICDVSPSCGPLVGSSILVVQGTHILDTNQVHVRFQSAANKHEFCVVRGRVSHTLPNGTACKLPVIICHAPKVERVSSLTLNAVAALTIASVHRAPVKPKLDRKMSRKPEMLRHQAKEASLRTMHRHAQPPDTLYVDGNSFGESSHPYLDALVDFSLNGGEQFLARSVPFRFYTPLDCSQLSFGPMHVPLANLDVGVGLTPPHRLRRLTLTGFYAPTLYDSKCMGIKFESIADDDDDIAHTAVVLPCALEAKTVVCDLPEFPLQGRYAVSFAINSQEFTPLDGALHVHTPLHIVECVPQQFPFQGGHTMHIRVAASSVMTHFDPNKSSHRVGFKRYHTTPVDRPRSVIVQDNDDWKPRRWHAIDVVIADKPLKNAHVTIVVRRVDTGWIISESAIDLDKTTSCDVEATDWIPGLTLLTAHLNDTYHPFKTLVHDVERPTVIVLVRRPSPTQLLGVGKLQVVDAAGLVVWTTPPDAESGVLPDSLTPGCWYYLFVTEPTTGPVLLVSSDQTILHVQSPPVTWQSDNNVACKWVVGAFQVGPTKLFVQLDQWVQGLEYASSLPRLDDKFMQSVVETPDMYSIPAERIWALGAESSVYLSVYLKGGTTNQVIKVSPFSVTALEAGQIYDLACTVPAFSAAGPITAWLAINDICFSNACTLHSYDPSTWHIQSVQPPCGLHGKSTPLKLRGIGFVETNALVVRFATPTRVIDVPGHIRLRQFFNVTVVGLSVAGRTYSENNLVFSLHVAYNDEVPVPTACRRMLYHLKKDMGTLLWNESSQFEVLEPQKTLRLVLRTTSDMGDMEETVKLRHKNFKVVAAGHWDVPDLELGRPFRHVVKLDNTDPTSMLRREVELNVCLDPPLLDTEMVVTRTPTLDQACSLAVQLSSGQHTWTPEESVQFHVYQLPRITQLKPPFLPYTTGGTVHIRGSGFFNSGMVMLKLCYVSDVFDYEHGEGEASIQAKLEHLLVDEDKMHELPVTFVSTTELKCDVPPRLKSRNMVFCVSFDHHTFTPLTASALFRMYDMQTVTPNGGPTQGRSYISLKGSNLSLCQSVDAIALVRFSWIRNGKLMERNSILGELNAGVLYCYTPTCRLGLDKLHVTLDVSLGGPDAPYSNDGLPFVYYKIPVLRSMSPKLHLVPGATDVSVHTVESWENTSALSLHDRKCRFRMKGQVQLANTSDAGGGLIRCRLPRFTVPVATPHLLPGAIKDDPLVNKLWVRNSGLFVTVLQARNLKLMGTNTTPNICPVVLLSLGDQRLRTAAKDCDAHPVFNEQFDFDLDQPTPQGELVITVEHELKTQRNDVVGTLRFPLHEVNHTVLLRAWFPLQPPQVTTVSTPQPQRTARQLLLEIAEKDRGAAPPARGEIELFIHFEPMMLKREPGESAVRGKLRSVMKKTMHVESIARRIRKGDACDNNENNNGGSTRNIVVPRVLKQTTFVVPTELVVELALNGQDFLSQCPLTCAMYCVQSLPIIENITPKCIPSRGGSKLSIHGHNFVDTKCIKVAFLWGVEHYAALKQAFRGDADLFASVPVTVVDAKYDSASLLYCTTPPTRFPPKPCFTLLVAVNGLDFNSIFLPPPHDANPIPDDLWHSFQVKELVAMPELPQHEWKIYETPVVHSIQSANAVYTTKLIFRGDNFGSADNPKALFVHVVTKPNEAKCEDAVATLSIMSSMQLECWAPDFPPGSMVQIQIAMNGHDFIDMPGLLCICNAPKLTKLEPSWVFSTGNHPLVILGSNFMDTGNITVSFVADISPKPMFVRGTCVNGSIRCNVPSTAHLETDDILCSSLTVDISLGKNNLTEYTGHPLTLSLYHNIPQLDQVTPTDGPIWGGTKLALRGQHFVDTATLVVRFTRLSYGVDPKTQVTKWHVVQDDDHCLIVKAEFDSPEQLTCVAPTMPDEGSFPLPVAVQLSLNGHDYSTVNDSTWFVAWRTWQTRVSLLKQSMHQDGGARLAWQKYFDMKHAPKLNFYGGRLKTTSWKIHDTHHPSGTPTPPKRVENLPEIMRDMHHLATTKPQTAPVVTIRGTGASDPDDDLPDSEIYIPPTILWPIHDGTSADDANLNGRLVDRLQKLYRSHATQNEIYSRLIFMYDNAAQLNAKYTSGHAIKPATPDVLGGGRRVSFPPLRRVASSHIDLKTLSRHTGLCFHGLCEGMRWIFPAVSEADLVDLWVFLDPTKTGAVSLDTFCSRLQISPRPPSPEPGPMHYDPQMPELHVPTLNIVESAVSPRPVTPQPFLDVGPAIDTLHPQSPRLSFTHFDAMKAQWCDPLYKGAGSEIAKPNVFPEQSRTRLSTSPRIHETKFPPLTLDETQIRLARERPKLPPPSYGILSLKIKASSPMASTSARRGTVVTVKGKVREPGKMRRDSMMLRRRTSTIFNKSSDVVRKASRAVGFARKPTMAPHVLTKQFKDVKAVYLDILASQPQHESPLK
ncbi:Aste57867_9987 [Aphanomyces stellatus]|uniref:Aste57867_9987 protein n=1 Tax=Aphanomyces stellatus TaxID=120398 RepID=A0A485KPA8_9STRA|nr:hypothetical protein As57867_009948 [Aphanomyces stellatus]VFT86865.1 Aste57867_9987 [Aphanomyces stellatus]